MFIPYNSKGGNTTPINYSTSVIIVNSSPIMTRIHCYRIYWTSIRISYVYIQTEAFHVFNKGRGRVVDGNNLRVIGVRGGSREAGGFVDGGSLSVALRGRVSPH